jgi:hypothetical protein
MLRLWALASVTAASMVVMGCATRSTGLGTARGPGEISAQPGIVVAAPHARSDVGTGAMATEIARLTGFGLVVDAGVPANEGPVDEAYERRVRNAARGPLRFYAELRGASRAESAEGVEIATVGVDAEQAQKLRTLFELVRDAHLRARPPGLRLAVRVAPADAAFDTAAGARRAGILRLPPRALSIELPRVARQEARELYTLILADFLREAIALPLPARR